MMSFPRDLVVHIPGCAGQLPFRGRINEAYTYCGPRGTLEDRQGADRHPDQLHHHGQLHRLHPHRRQARRVYMDVDHRYLNDNSSGGRTTRRSTSTPGYQQLTGSEALDFVRFRHTDSDLYRVVRQQEFVKAMKQQVSEQLVADEDPGIVNTITENVEVGVGGDKTLDFDTLYSYAKLAYGLPTGNFQQVQIEGITGYNELVGSAQQSIDDAVDDFMNPDVYAPEKAPTPRSAASRRGTPARALPGDDRGPERERHRRRCRRRRRRSRPARLPVVERRQRRTTSTTSSRRSSTTRPSPGARRPPSGSPISSATRSVSEVPPGLELDDDAAGDRRPDLPRRPHAPARRTHAAARAAGGRQRLDAAGAPCAPPRRRLPALVPTRRESSLVARHDEAAARTRSATTTLRLTYQTGRRVLGDPGGRVGGSADPRRGQRHAGDQGARVRLYFDGPKLHMVAFRRTAPPTGSSTRC